jgi:ketosteroid isomerase-like protein
MQGADRHLLVIVCAVVLFGGWLSPGKTSEVSMGHEQSAPAHVQATEQATEKATRTTVNNFNEAFNRHDADALAAFLTEDTIFEDTSPAPDGRRVEGKAAVVDFWRGWFTRNADARFDAEEVIVSGNRAVVLWVYRKMRNGQPWHIRGVDVFTVRDGKVAAKLAYVKG